MGFILAADTSGDIPRTEMTARNIEYKSLVYTIDGVEYPDNFSLDSEYKAFYDEIRAGKLPTTSQINTLEHEEFFESLLQKYEDDILYVTLSSGLSGSYESAVLAAKNLLEKTGRKIYVVDSLGATISQRKVVDKAEQLRNDGLSAKEAAAVLVDYVKHIQTWFMPTDLKHLCRGGRVSRAAATFGTMLNIKPVLFIDRLGKLPVIKKLRGASNGMTYMLERFKEYATATPHRVYIASADSDFAEEMRQKVKDARPDCDVVIGWIGPVIGAHTGCGAVGVSFESDIERPY
ncbi:MAG: DegV family protein [Clostridiales bacterium]|nr:DegV family protein [Clostridiales bacterium]